MFCVNCGKQVDENWKFCSFCGSVLADVSYENKKNNQPKIDYSLLELDNDFDDEETEPTVVCRSSKTNEAKIIPNISNIKQMYDVKYEKTSKLKSSGKMDICVQWDDKEEDVYDDITEYLYNCINITRKKDIVADAWELYGIKAYTLGNKGIYFVMPDDRICYMDETGEVTTIATQPNVVNMEWDVVDKILMLKIYNGMTQIASREHRDEGGYMYEAWYDVYQVNTETKIITIN